MIKHALARTTITVWMVGCSGLCAERVLATADSSFGWYVAMSRGAVSIMDPVADQSYIGQQAGTDLALSADGNRLLVAAYDSLTVLDAHTLSPLTTLFAEEKGGFYRVAISPDGTQAAVGTGSLGEVLLFDLATERFVGAIKQEVSDQTIVGGLAYSPDGRHLYATMSVQSDIAPRRTGALLVLDPTTLQVDAVIKLTDPAQHIVVTSDGRRGYIADGQRLTEVDLMTHEVTRDLFVDTDATDIALAPDERHAYILGSEPPSVIVVELNTLVQERRQLASCGTARRLAVAPDGHSLATAIEGLSVVALVDLDDGSVSAFRVPYAPRAVVAADVQAPTDTRGEPLLRVAPEFLSSCGATITIGNAIREPGGQTEVALSVDSLPGVEVAGIQADIIFDPSQIALDPDIRCQIDPAVGTTAGCDEPNPPAPCKRLYADYFPCSDVAGCPSGLDDWVLIRSLVLALSNVNPIPAGVVYRCRFDIPADATPRTTIPLRCHNAGASTPQGAPIPAICRDGSITIADREPTPTAPAAPAADGNSNTPIGERPQSQGDATTISTGGCEIAQTESGASVSLLPLLPLCLALLCKRIHYV